MRHLALLSAIACGTSSPQAHHPTPIIATAHAMPEEASTLTPSEGTEIGWTFEAFLSPHQEPAEEADMPAAVPAQFRSTAPSKTRDQRDADGHRGHGTLRFAKDFSRAWVEVQIEGIDPATINMFHIHCGLPGILGPILVDFAHGANVSKQFEGGRFEFEVRNKTITDTVNHAHGILGAFTGGCLIPSPTLELGAPPKVSTVAGMAQIAQQGELYFNLHTTGQTYYGDIRGQLHPIE